MIAAAQWLRIWVIRMELPGSKAGKFCSTFFMYYDCSIRIFQPCDLQLFGCCLNSIAVNAISFKPQNVSAMMVNLYEY